MTDQRPDDLSDEASRVPPTIDTTVAHPARTYDYLLGGKDNFAVDRAVAEKAVSIAPDARDRVRANRSFLRRAVQFLVKEAGIRQFLDIGTGLPTQGNVHEIAQQIAPDTKVVYIDNDPIVLVHARALLAGDGSTTVVQADLRQPEVILNHPEVRKTLDFEAPMALLLVAILHFIRDSEDPAAIVARLRDALPAGSYLVLSHLTTDLGQGAQQVARLFDDAAAPMIPRPGSEIMKFFEGFELIDPGLVQVPLWRPDEPSPENLDRIWFYGAVARKL